MRYLSDLSPETKKLAIKRVSSRCESIHQLSVITMLLPAVLSLNAVNGIWNIIAPCPDTDFFKPVYIMFGRLSVSVAPAPSVRTTESEDAVWFKNLDKSVAFVM